MAGAGPAEPPSASPSDPSASPSDPSEPPSGPSTQPSGPTPEPSAPSADLSRLAALHGVATSYNPSPDRTVAASATAVTRALAALGVDAGTPEAVRDALTAREREQAERLLPPTVVGWGTDMPPALADSPKAPGCSSAPSRARPAPRPRTSRPACTG
ncbi:4-alpha-glucanotransferase [Streptomyces hirsutus]